MGNELLLASPVTSYLQGREARQQNQLGQLQLQGAQQQLTHAQDQSARDDQFRNALGAYLQGGSNNLAELYTADPEKAMQIQAFQVQQQQQARQKQIEDAKQVYAAASAVLTSAAPAARAKVLHPQAVTEWARAHGKSPDDMTDDEARAIAGQVRDQAGAVAGIVPKIERVDLGDRISLRDETGREVGSEPKGVTPGEKLTAASTAHSQAIAVRGQDLAAKSAARGQDLTAETARSTAGAKVTESQGNAKAFGLRATAANTALEKLITPRKKGGGGYVATGAGGTWDMLTAGRTNTNWLASAAGQKYQNLAKAFIAPILRKESGAAISESEWTSAKQLYIPWPGDQADVLTQKAENRINAIQGLSEQAGPGGIPRQPHGASGGWSIEPVS